MKHEGKLKHNELGRYTFEDGYYFTSGEEVEIYINEWLKGSIEYDLQYGDYYFINSDERKIYNLEGINARIK